MTVPDPSERNTPDWNPFIGPPTVRLAVLLPPSLGELHRGEVTQRAVGLVAISGWLLGRDLDSAEHPESDGLTLRL
jgi:hypothetical protein